VRQRKIGLARALSKLGYRSRSQAAELVLAGRVCLNGKVRRDPETPVWLYRDRIVVDGHAVAAREKVYLAMNKPRGVVTTASDEKRRETVYDFLIESERGVKVVVTDPLPWVAPVGRLDKASEGLLLMTNDSEWGARVTSPETHLEKTYHVQLAKLVENSLVESLVRGVKAADGELLRAKRARLLRAGEKNCWLEIVLDEGKNRQIRRMLEMVDVEVLRLVRVAIGPLLLGDLAKGKFRSLTTQEKRMLDGAMEGCRG